MSLSSLTSGAQSAAVYVRAPGKTKQIAFSLCRPCSTSGNGSYSGPPAATSTLLGAALAREAYVNVATKKNPAGEIRGQVGIVAKSEPHLSLRRGEGCHAAGLPNLPCDPARAGRAAGHGALAAAVWPRRKSPLQLVALGYTRSAFMRALGSQPRTATPSRRARPA
jgi:hypothetical protein